MAAADTFDSAPISHSIKPQAKLGSGSCRQGRKNIKHVHCKNIASHLNLSVHVKFEIFQFLELRNLCKCVNSIFKRLKGSVGTLFWWHTSWDFKCSYCSSSTLPTHSDTQALCSHRSYFPSPNVCVCVLNNKNKNQIVVCHEIHN